MTLYFLHYNLPYLHVGVLHQWIETVPFVKDNYEHVKEEYNPLQR